jgi:hypothetical protein
VKRSERFTVERMVTATSAVYARVVPGGHVADAQAPPLRG